MFIFWIGTDCEQIEHFEQLNKQKPVGFFPIGFLKLFGFIFYH